VVPNRDCWIGTAAGVVRRGVGVDRCEEQERREVYQ